jgi:hypothetical protein
MQPLAESARRADRLSHSRRPAAEERRGSSRNDISSRGMRRHVRGRQRGADARRLTSMMLQADCLRMADALDRLSDLAPNRIRPIPPRSSTSCAAARRRWRCGNSGARPRRSWTRWTVRSMRSRRTAVVRRPQPSSCRLFLAAVHAGHRSTTSSGRPRREGRHGRPQSAQRSTLDPAAPTRGPPEGSEPYSSSIRVEHRPTEHTVEEAPEASDQLSVPFRSEAAGRFRDNHAMTAA